MPLPVRGRRSTAIAGIAKGHSTFSHRTPRSSGRLLCNWVDELIPADRLVVVIPLSDRLVEYLHRQRSGFPPRFRLAIPSAELADDLLDKSQSLRIAQQAGLDVPDWVEVTSIDGIEAATTLDYPVVVRPTSWSSTGDHYFKVMVCKDQRELEVVLTESLQRGARLIAQRYIDAPDDAVEFAITWRNGDGSCTVTCTGRKRRQSAPEGGVMAWGEATALPDVADRARRFLEATGFTGPGGIEFIRHDGRLWFIEFNPRLEAIHFLAAAAGLDTVVMTYREQALGEAPQHPPLQRDAAGWVGAAWLNRLVSRPGDWRLAASDRVAFARSENRIKAVVDFRDPLPSVALTFRLISRAVLSSHAGAGR
ncbi:MAG: ATP-grasp domain-containing protein [Microthrixaceae bacterium]|nr:ATP-grasp domain-containing protein [Microthrixaceae bacterium]